MDHSAFDTARLDGYAERAKAQWGDSPEYKEYERRSDGMTKEKGQGLAESLMKLFAEFGEMRDSQPESEQAQRQVKKLQDYISANFYKCSDDTLFGLGQMYADGGEFTENIDKAGGEGTALFASEAIRIYCGK